LHTKVYQIGIGPNPDPRDHTQAIKWKESTHFFPKHPKEDMLTTLVLFSPVDGNFRIDWEFWVYFNFNPSSFFGPVRILDPVRLLEWVKVSH